MSPALLFIMALSHFHLGIMIVFSNSFCLESPHLLPGHSCAFYCVIHFIVCIPSRYNSFAHCISKYISLLWLLIYCFDLVCLPSRFYGFAQFLSYIAYLCCLCLVFPSVPSVECVRYFMQICYCLCRMNQL